MDAIITDIHGNLEALDAVLDAIGDSQSSRIICLGDLVCYGPDSIECVRRSSDWDIVILGDWDATLLAHDPSEWNSMMNLHIEYVRREFDISEDSDFLYSTIRSYHESHNESGIDFVHGTSRGKRDWVFPEDAYDSRKLNKIAERFENVCICGHAHLNGVYRQHDSTWEFVQPEPGICYDIGIVDKTIVTVGSVGQPRDDDPRATFATRDGNFVTFHRVAYDVETTVNKIRANPNIDEMYGDRLLHGR
tara:strand:+ start:1329 stop:2072 length:744 start_codon:yes stop_codon:yes gene_type:complete